MKFTAGRDERGVTLIEVVVVGVLATIVMLALTGFYINSQGTWIDSSGQALAQREGTLLMSTIVDSVHASSSADPFASVLILRDPGGVERCRFWWNLTDSLLHMGRGATDFGPMNRSTVTGFDVWTTGDLVGISRLALRTPSGHILTFATGAKYYNKP